MPAMSADGRPIVRLSVDLIGPEEVQLHKRLKHLAIEQERPVRELVVEAVMQYLEREGEARLKRRSENDYEQYP